MSGIRIEIGSRPGEGRGQAILRVEDDEYQDTFQVSVSEFEHLKAGTYREILSIGLSRCDDVGITLIEYAIEDDRSITIDGVEVDCSGFSDLTKVRPKPYRSLFDGRGNF